MEPKIHQKIVNIHLKILELSNLKPSNQKPFDHLFVFFKPPKCSKISKFTSLGLFPSCFASQIPFEVARKIFEDLAVDEMLSRLGSASVNGSCEH